MNNLPPNRPDAASYGFFWYAVLLLMIPFGLPACIIVAPFSWYFEMGPGNSVALWAIGIVDVILVFCFLYYLEEKGRS